jgi:hypothetical protein
LRATGEEKVNRTVYQAFLTAIFMSFCILAPVVFRRYPSDLVNTARVKAEASFLRIMYVSGGMLVSCWVAFEARCWTLWCWDRNDRVEPPSERHLIRGLGPSRIRNGRFGDGYKHRLRGHRNFPWPAMERLGSFVPARAVTSGLGRSGSYSIRAPSEFKASQ